jgi:hypothetical protein
VCRSWCKRASRTALLYPAGGMGAVVSSRKGQTAMNSQPASHCTTGFGSVWTWGSSWVPQKPEGGTKKGRGWGSDSTWKSEKIEGNSLVRTRGKMRRGGGRGEKSENRKDGPARETGDAGSVLEDWCGRCTKPKAHADPRPGPGHLWDGPSWLGRDN